MVDIALHIRKAILNRINDYLLKQEEIVINRTNVDTKHIYACPISNEVISTHCIVKLALQLQI